LFGSRVEGHESGLRIFQAIGRFERVLLIDSDPQGNASTGLGVGRAQRKTTLYDVLMGEHTIAESAVKTSVPGSRWPAITLSGVASVKWG